MQPNPILKAFFADKAAQVAWADFIIAELDKEALHRVYNGEDTKALKEAKEIIEQSFKTLNELFTPKQERPAVSRAE